MGHYLPLTQIHFSDLSSRIGPQTRYIGFGGGRLSVSLKVGTAREGRAPQMVVMGPTKIPAVGGHRSPEGTGRRRKVPEKGSRKFLEADSYFTVGPWGPALHGQHDP